MRPISPISPIRPIEPQRPRRELILRTENRSPRYRDDESHLYNDISANLGDNYNEEEEGYAISLKKVETHSKKLEIAIPDSMIEPRGIIANTDSLIKMKIVRNLPGEVGMMDDADRWCGRFTPETFKNSYLKLGDKQKEMAEKNTHIQTKINCLTTETKKLSSHIKEIRARNDKLKQDNELFAALLLKFDKDQLRIKLLESKVKAKVREKQAISVLDSHNMPYSHAIGREKDSRTRIAVQMSKNVDKDSNIENSCKNILNMLQVLSPRKASNKGKLRGYASRQEIPKRPSLNCSS